MDPVQAVEETIQIVTVAKYLLIGGSVLALYDYLLVLDDEVQYMWKGRKTRVFYLYMLNRITFNAFLVWQLYAVNSPRHPTPWCIAAYRTSSILTLFFFTFSDIFIMLRIYALTLRNKPIVAFFGAISVAKAGMWFATFFPHVTVLEPPNIPIEAFSLCATVSHSPFKIVPVILGTVFDVSAFFVIAWCAYRSMPILRLSAVVRTIVTEGTIYFLAMFAMQIYVQLSYILMETVSREYSYIVYSIINPVLTLRFALSLKRSAEAEYELTSIQFSSAKFGSGTLAGSQVPDAFEGIEMGLTRSPKGPVAFP